MGNKKTGTIQVRAESGKMGKIVIPGAISLVALDTFITSVESAFMTGKCVAASWAETKKIAAEISGGNTDRRGIIVYNDNTNNITKRISIPSWGTEAGDSFLTPEGERIPLTACNSVISALETATGTSLTAVEGYIIQGR